MSNTEGRLSLYGFEQIQLYGSIATLFVFSCRGRLMNSSAHMSKSHREYSSPSLRKQNTSMHKKLNNIHSVEQNQKAFYG